MELFDASMLASSEEEELLKNATVETPALALAQPTQAPAEAAPAASTPAPARSYNVPANIKSVIEEASDRANVPTHVMLAIAKQESSFNPNARARSSSAKGLYQHIDSTWSTLINQAGPLYGIPTNASPFDARASAFMGAEYARQNKVAIEKEFGRPIKDGEYYIAHFMGLGGAKQLIRANETSPNANAADLFPKEAKANPTIFYDNGKPRTVRQLYAKLSSVVDGNTEWKATGDVSFTPTLAPSQIKPPVAAPRAGAMIDAAQSVLDDEANNRETRQWYSNIADAFRQDNLEVRAWEVVKNAGRFDADPNFLLTPQVQDEVMKQYGLNEEYRESLVSAVSREHLDFLGRRAQEDQTREQHLAEAGWTGLGLRVVATMLSPSAIAAGLLSGGLADAAVIAAKGGRIARIAAQATAGAGANVSLDVALGQLGHPDAGKHLLMSAAAGAVFGSAYGLIAKNPATLEEAALLGDAARTMRKAMEESAALTPADGKSVGAAQNLVAQYPFLNNKAWTAVQEDDVAYTAFHKKLFGIIPKRFDVVGQLKSLKSAGYRLIGGHLGEDAVANADHSVNAFSVTEDMERHYRIWTTELRQAWKPAAEQWARDMNKGAFGAFRYGAEFNTEVYRYVINPRADIQVHQSIKLVGDKIRRLNAEILKLAKNPFEYEGLVGRAVQGFEEVPENPFYMMRAFDLFKINTARTKFGDAGIISFLRGAIRSAQPELEDELLDKLAEGFAKRITRRANGIDDKMNLITSGFDREQLKEILVEAGVTEEKANSLIASVRVNKKASADARAKRRVLMDETYVDPKTGMSLEDLVITDASILSDLYFRHMAGRIALARMRVKNPRSGEMLVNGVVTDNEWVSLKNRLREKGATDGLSKAELDTADANLQFLYDRILGRADPDQQGAAADWLRRGRKLMHARLGWGFGVAQLPEAIQPLVQVGVKAALSQMPALRRIVKDGSLRMRDELAAELEAILGIGADRLRGMQFFRHEDFGQAVAGVQGKLDNALDLGVKLTNEGSGMSFVNAVLQRWTAKVIVQKFADMALDPSKVNMKRMRALGLSDEMLDRVLKQTKWFTKEKGLLFDKKVTRMNLDKWDDLEARSAFEMAVFRWSRRVIQENDIGNMHRWASKPLWQMFMQFRAFPLTAYSKQFLHNLYMRDMQSFNMMWMSVAMGAAVYATQQHLASIGRSDREEFLKKRLSIESLAKGGFQRSGWSSILPMVWDTGAYLSGFNPAFDFRTSGQPSDIIFGNPVMSFMDDISKASKGIIQPILEGRERSQLEYRNIMRAFPLANWLPATMLLSTMISDKPERPPYGNR